MWKFVIWGLVGLIVIVAVISSGGGSSDSGDGTVPASHVPAAHARHHRHHKNKYAQMADDARRNARDFCASMSPSEVSTASKLSKAVDEVASQFRASVREGVEEGCLAGFKDSGVIP